MDFELACFRCTQSGITITFPASNDGKLHFKLVREEKSIGGIFADPASAAFCLEYRRSEMLAATAAGG